MTDIYTELSIDAQRKEFRLLTILPMTSTLKLRCQLTTASLLDVRQRRRDSLIETIPRRSRSSDGSSDPGGPRRLPPNDGDYRFEWGDFAALSYVWGDPSRTTFIEVNGINVVVTKNLEDALLCLRQTGCFSRDYKIWVDALCINQADDEERAQQVAVMREYYSAAWFVVGYLGPASDDSDRAVRFLRQLANTTFDECEEMASRLVNVSGQSELTSRWLALSKFVCRPYWTRLWIMQELALGGKRTILYCGSTLISWDTLCHTVAKIHGQSWFAKYTAIEKDCAHMADAQTRLRDFDDVLYRLQRDLWMLSTCEASAHRFGFNKLIEMSSHAECSDPRDRVYGMLGLMDERTTRLIQPDYTIEADEIFMRVAEAHISAHSNLEFLRVANLWGSSGAPTWAPDWTWTGRQQDSRPDDWSPEWLSESEGDNLEHHSYIGGLCLPWEKARRYGRLLKVKVVFFDEVDGLGTSPMIERDRPLILQSKGHQSAYGDFHQTARHLNVALYADRKRCAGDSINLLNLPRDADSASKRFEELGWTMFLNEIRFYGRWEDWCRCNGSLLVAGVPFGDHLTGSIPDGADENKFFRAYQAWTRTAIAGKRRFITTASGRFGWVSCATGIEHKTGLEAESGDVLAAFPGCSMPILLRPTEASDMFEVSGEAYVHGVMEGEIAELLKSGEARWQNIFLR